MTVSDPAPCLYEFGPFRVDTATRQVQRDGVRVPLTRKAFDTLLLLLAEAGRPVSKERLLEEVWAGTVVGEATLTQNIYTLRKALKVGPGPQAVIETLPGVGYRFVAAVKRAAPAERLARRRKPVESLAVLPFRSLDPDPDHLGICLADALITRFSRLGRLVVRPSSAMFRYADRDTDPVAVGRELRVDAVLEGTLLRSKGRLRAMVQLVDVGATSPLWAERFDVPFADVFAAEDEISEQVMTTLLERDDDLLAGGRWTKGTGPSVEAHRAYVRGRFFWNKRTRDGLEKAIESFRLALQLSPGYAEAYAGLADCFALHPVYADVPPRDSFPKAREAAERALRLRDTIPEPHASLAYTRFLYDWDWDAAEEGFARSLHVDPNYSTAHHWRAFLLAARGRSDEAVVAAERALELDPLSLAINADLALILHFARRHEEAIRQCQRTLELEPTFAYARFVLGLASLSAGRGAEGVASFRAAVESSERNSLMLSGLGWALGVAGDPDSARRIVAELEERFRGKPLPHSRLALVHAGCGDRAAALDALEHAVEERSRVAVFLDAWPAFAGLRGEPRFEALLTRIGLRAGGASRPPAVAQ